MDFRLPNLGEGIEGGTVTSVLVKVGDLVKAGQNVVAIETDKAAVEVPADADGVVEAVHVKPGDKATVGGKLLSIKASGASTAPLAASRVAPQPAPAKPQAAAATFAAPQ